MSGPATCGHCGRHAAGIPSDFIEALAYGSPLCHPNVGMDCYRLVTVWGEPLGARLPNGSHVDKPRPIPDNGWWN